MADIFAALGAPALLSFVALLVGFAVIRFVTISLRSFLGVYILLTTGHLAFLWNAATTTSLIVGAVSATVGVVAMLIAVGMIGKTRSSANYQTLLVGVGLFPWFLGWHAILAYLVVAALCTVAVLITRFWVACRKQMQEMKAVLQKSKIVPEPVREDIFSYFRQVIVTTPVAIGALAAIPVYLFL